MAETYEQYEKNKQRVTGKPGIGELIDAAMDQTELLQGVARRVTVFVEAYQKWADLDPVYQEVRGLPHQADEPEPVLTFDDLKILLDKFPQQDW